MVWVLLLCLGALAMPQAEVDRISVEIQRLAAKGAWSGVERNYALVLDGGGHLDRRGVLLAAQSARITGDVLSWLERLAQAQALEHTPEVQAELDVLMSSFGRVQLLPGRNGGELVAAQLPFRPDEAQAVRFAIATVASGPFNGFLPPGDYTFDGEAFSVSADQELEVIGDGHHGDADDVTVAGVSFPRRASVHGHKVELNGVGVRAKFGVNIYVAALYLTQRNWSAHRIIRQEGAKRLVLEFVHRKVTREQMADQFRQSIENQRLDPDQPDFLPLFAMLRDVEQGEHFSWEYDPERGSTLRLGRDAPVDIPGEVFAVAWQRIFLGAEPASERLKEGLCGGVH